MANVPAAAVVVGEETTVELALVMVEDALVTVEDALVEVARVVVWATDEADENQFSHYLVHH